MIEALAEAGVSLDEDTDGSSPLRHALRMYALKSFETLLTLGANPNVKDESGETLLHFIVGIAYVWREVFGVWDTRVLGHLLSASQPGFPIQ